MQRIETTPQAVKIGNKGVMLAIVLCMIWVIATSIAGAFDFYEDIRSGSHARVLVTVFLPSVFFAILFMLRPAVRDWTRHLNPAMLVLPHAWRTVGFTFLVLWAYDILPAGFAAPAGFGDFVIAMAAPFVAVALWVQWKGAVRTAIWFHVLGFADLFIALLTGITGFGMQTAQMGQIDPMTTFPLVWIPTVAVPLLIAGHLIALLNLYMNKVSR
ncbi:hypothetical protein [Aliiroseovarius sp. 2305UL8-7]|uniref:hypothetical protein n=1 Tax=Aliiroseovarius conchicola TaxID=3121637 RepID=UPI003529BB21